MIAIKKQLVLFLIVLLAPSVYGQNTKHFDIAYKSYLKGDFEKAVKYYDLSIKENPKHADSYYFKAMILGRMGQFEESEVLFNKAIELNPEDGAYIGDRGVLYANQGKMDLAIQDFKLAAKLDFSNPSRHFNLASYYMEKGDYITALKYFDDCLKVDENHLGARFQRGICNTIMNQKDNSLEDFTYLIDNFENQSTALNPRDYNELLGASFFLRGGIYGERKEYQKSVADLKKAIKYIDNDPEMYNSLGYYMIFTDELEEGISYLDKSIEMYPTPLNYTSRAFAYYKKKNYEKAESDAMAAKKLEEYYPETYYYLALIYQATGKAEAARQMKEKAIELGSKQARDLELD